MEGGCGWGLGAWGIASSSITGPQKLKHLKQFDVPNTGPVVVYYVFHKLSFMQMVNFCQNQVYKWCI